ncbi:hypothetical protein ACFX2G_035537 [Malus domestica]
MLVCKPWLQVCKDPCLNSAFDLERRIDSMLRSVVHWSAGSLEQICTRHCSNQSFLPQSTAKNLMPKDGQGTSSPYAIVDFDGQRRRTKTKQRDLNPEWDEKLEFLVNDSESMATEIIEINIYNDKKAAKRNTFLGKVKIPGNTFVKSDAAALVYFSREKRSVFSQIKGEVGLKILSCLCRSSTIHARRHRPLKPLRKVPKTPHKVLDAPSLQDDFYLNLVEWSSQNALAVGLGTSVYL